MNTNKLSSYVDHLISNYAYKSDYHYDLEVQDLPEYAKEEFAINMFSRDECCMDFILDNPENVAKIFLSYMIDSSVDKAIEISNELRVLLVKHYAKRMQSVIDDQLETIN